jgi:hypothetical protein
LGFSVLRSEKIYLHWDLFLELEELGIIYCILVDCREVVGDGVVGVGTTDDDDGVLSGIFVYVDEGFSGWDLGDEFPGEGYFCLLHLFFEVSHLVILADLSSEYGRTGELSCCDCLVGSFATIGDDVSVSLDCLTWKGDMFDIDK